MNEVSHWVKGRLSEPSTYAAASVAAIGGWVLTAQMSWIWVALASGSSSCGNARKSIGNGSLWK